jgi:hypothetical protein
MVPKVPSLTIPTTTDRNALTLPESVVSERMMPSGVFMTDDPRPESTPVMCNPCFFGPADSAESIEAPPQKVRDLRQRYGEIVEVSAGSFKSYADMLTRVRADFNDLQVDAVIVPLCGALRPASFILPMGNFDVAMLPIPFTRGSSGLFDKQILNVLGEQLAPFYRCDPLKVGILDTGVGGQSMIHLVTLLRKLHDDAAPQSEWSVHCNIVIADDNLGYLDRTNDVKEQKSERFFISRKVFPTQNLVAEDVKAALEYQVDWGDRGAGYVHPVSSRGALVLRRPDGVEILPRENLARSLDQRLAEATTAALQGESGIFLRNIWEPGSDGVV